MEAIKASRMEPQGAPDQIVVLETIQRECMGMIACAVTISNRPNDVFALSCRHVFSVPELYHPRNPHGALVRGRPTNRRNKVAEVVSYRGDFNTYRSLDAQLAIVNDSASRGHLRRVLNGLALDGGKPYARAARDIPTVGYLRSPDGILKTAITRSIRPASLYYRGVGYIKHTAIYPTACQTPGMRFLAGYSGAAITSKPNGGMLLGMHFAGDEHLRTGMMIPAWQLFDASRYSYLSPNAKITPINI